jgi:hypothetical protein
MFSILRAKKLFSKKSDSDAADGSSEAAGHRAALLSTRQRTKHD